MDESVLPICPLSGSRRVNRIAAIRTKDIAALFHSNVGIDIRYLTESRPEICLYHSEDTDLYFFHPSIVADDHLYEQLQRFPWYYAADKQEYAYARTLIGPGDAVLDIGSGCGGFAQKLDCRHYQGLELNSHAVASAAQMNVAVACESIDIHAGQHQDEYDVVCAFQVLEHVADIAGFLRSALICLKPGGKLIVAVPSYDSFSRYVLNFSLDLPPHHQSRWTDRALRSVAATLSLELIDIWHEPLQDAHRLMYCHTVCQSALCSLLAIEPRQPIDRRWRIRALSFASTLLSHFFSAGFSKDFIAPRGLSVTAVYRKPNLRM